MAVGREYSCMYICAAAMFRHMRLRHKRKRRTPQYWNTFLQWLCYWLLFKWKICILQQNRPVRKGNFLLKYVLMKDIILNFTILIVKLTIRYSFVYWNGLLAFISNIYVDIDIQMDIQKIIAILYFPIVLFPPQNEIKSLIIAWFLSEAKCIELFILHSVLYALCVYSILSCITSLWVLLRIFYLVGSICNIFLT